MGLGRLHDLGGGRADAPAAPPLLLRPSELPGHGAGRGRGVRADAARRPDRLRSSSPTECPSSTSRPESQSTASDLEILRAFEPIVRYTQGEKFFPMDVERYVRASSLWLYVPDGADEEVVPEGALTLEGLVERRDAPFGSLFYLRFVGPLDLQESAQALAGQRQLAKRQQSEFHAGVGRLARGGLLPRLGDGLFSLSLLLRGNVPGATAAAAALKYARDARAGRAVRLPGPGRAPERLDDLPVLVLLRLQPLALRLPRRQRPRVRLGDDLRLPLRGGRAARARVGRVRVARLPRRRPPPPLGRPRRPRARGRAPGRVRGRRLARLLLQARRVPGRGADPGPAAVQAARRGAGRLLADEARPGRRDEEPAPHPLHRLRPRRRAGDRAGTAATSGRRT